MALGAAALALAACTRTESPAASSTTPPAAASTPAAAANPLVPPSVVATSRSRAADCDRACLEGFVDRYFAGVIADDPKLASLAPNVRFTENGQLLPLGEGLWKSMKEAGKYRLAVTDPDAGQIALITTVVEDHRDPALGTPSLLALRLKVENGLITEIEQVVERNTETAANVEGLGAPRAQFLTPIPQAERMSRAALIAAADKYFTGMQRNDGKGDYPFHARCNRIENGRQSTNVPPRDGEPRVDPRTAMGYSGQWTCLEQFRSGMLYFVSRIRDRRYVAVDEERGVVAAFAFFDHIAGDTRNFTLPDGREMTAGPTQPWTWEILEFFKVENGQLAEIEAFLTRPPYGMLSGWSSYEDGMSDRARDVTGYSGD
jgi:hypothetical protein